MALLQNLTPRAFQSAKSSLRHKWECDYATNHYDSRTVITTRRAGLARWKLTSSSEGGGTVTPRAINRTLTLKTRIIPNFPPNFVKSQHLCWDFERQISSRIAAALKTSYCHVSLKVTMQYSTTIQKSILKSSWRTEQKENRRMGTEGTEGWRSLWSFFFLYYCLILCSHIVLAVLSIIHDLYMWNSRKFIHSFKVVYFLIFLCIRLFLCKCWVMVCSLSGTVRILFLVTSLLHSFELCLANQNTDFTKKSQSRKISSWTSIHIHLQPLHESLCQFLLCWPQSLWLVLFFLV